MSNGGNAGLLGRLAVHKKMITMEQLVAATLEQGRFGNEHKRLGEILVEKGFVSAPQLDQLLALQRAFVSELEQHSDSPPGPSPTTPTPTPTTSPGLAQSAPAADPFARAPAPTAPAAPSPSVTSPPSPTNDPRAIDLDLGPTTPAPPAPTAPTQPLELNVEDEAASSPPFAVPNVTAPPFATPPTATTPFATPPPATPPIAAPPSATPPTATTSAAPPAPAQSFFNTPASTTSPVVAPTAAPPTAAPPTTSVEVGDARAGPTLAQLSARGGPSSRLDAALTHAARAGASDVHLHPGEPMKVRMHGNLDNFGNDPLDARFVEEVVLEALNPTQRAVLDETGQIDLAHTVEGSGRFRGNVYSGNTGLNAVFRFVPGFIPSLTQLGLPSDLSKVTTFHQGMVLVTGPTGCGKSTTLASLVNIINEERNDHILSIEDPIEYLHTSKRCLVNQRQVSRHTESFARALRAALREDPDIIVIGELRDLETISLALTAAETGHLVLGTLHTGNAITTINRIIGAFPPDEQSQIRSMFSESLRAIVSQRLVRRADNQGRAVGLEVLRVTKAVSNIIREGRAFQLRSLLQTGGGQGQLLLDNSLAELVRSGVVTKEEATRHAEDPRLLG